MDTLTIGVLAKQAGVAPGTLRYYERVGLLAPAARSLSGYRLYPREEIKRLRFIRRAQELGFSLEEVALLLRLHADSAARARDVKTLAEEKIADIERRIRDLTRMKEGLNALSRTCDGTGPAATCPILAALNADQNHGD